jgi:hypothetical protein
VPHGAELQYVWRDMSALQPPTGTAADVALSTSVINYFLNFARTGDPNNSGRAPPPTPPPPPPPSSSSLTQAAGGGGGAGGGRDGAGASARYSSRSRSGSGSGSGVPAGLLLPYWPRFESDNKANPGGRGDVTMQLDVGEKLMPVLERGVAECAWWAENDLCYIGGQSNATRQQREKAQEIGCGTL